MRKKLAVRTCVLVFGFFTVTGPSKPAGAAVHDARFERISLSTGITRSDKFTYTPEGLALQPLESSQCWKNQWIVTNPISLDGPFRLPRRVQGTVTANILRSTVTPVNLFVRYTVDRTNWSSWHPLAAGGSPEAERFTVDLRIPDYQFQAYEDFIHEWYFQTAAGNDVRPLKTLDRVILAKDPNWFQKHIPVIREVQFLIDLPRPCPTPFTVRSLTVSLNWVTNHRREDLWFPNDPPGLRQSILGDLPMRQRTVSDAPKTAVRTAEEPATPAWRLCRLQVFNGSNLPLSQVTIGITSNGSSQPGYQLQYRPVNWDEKVKNRPKDVHPDGWEERLLSMEPPEVPHRRYATRWHAKKREAEIASGEYKNFLLPLHPQEPVRCHDLQWTVTYRYRP